MNSFKRQCNEITEVIISCWDSNNLDDNLTFDQRLEKKIPTLTEGEQNIIKQVIGGY